ncbi:uncharacterized protein AFUA_4G14160 [Aspergillus fumigatus Af293]|uniref:Uncharacterized protein n=2 Tax=Aspergillus fumigatus TaxID=746128 RepID=Q4WQV6_ASPFU|nr:conserved hypothetical protein [Aspergillus fumigatus Af293]EAL89378.1 conserved hypothetical protein [Aspergillus fumigatus Af293]
MASPSPLASSSTTATVTDPEQQVKNSSLIFSKILITTMHFSKIAISIGLLATAATAAPRSFEERSPLLVGEIVDLGVTPLSAGDLEKRDIIDLGVTNDSDDLEKRGKSNYISSCGDNWMPIADDKRKSHSGYKSAVEQYCYHVTHSQDGLPTVIGAGQKHAAIVKNGYYLKGDVPAAVDFEIHNKMKDGDHTPNQADCETYLMKMADPSSKCYGSKNKDTKGGTWQIGDNDVSYHALPKPNAT